MFPKHGDLETSLTSFSVQIINETKPQKKKNMNLWIPEMLQGAILKQILLKAQSKQIASIYTKSYRSQWVTLQCLFIVYFTFRDRKKSTKSFAYLLIF